MSNLSEYPISSTECPMSKWNALRKILSQRRRGAKGIALFLTGFKKLSQRRKDAKVKVKADDNLFLTGLGIEAEHFSTLQLCNPVNPVNPVPNKAMPSAPLRLCEKEKRRHGFTLVETALALLAIGLGLIALFGVGRIALESSREAENDRRCAMMADAIFETLRAVNAIYIEEARTIGQNIPEGDDVPSVTLDHWGSLWNHEVPLRGDDPPLPLWDNDGRLLFPPVGGMRSMVTNDVPLIYTMNGTDYTSDDARYIFLSNVNTYCFTYSREDPPSLAHWNPLYQLYILTYDDGYYSSVAESPHVSRLVVLFIYPDGLTASSDYRIFTTTLSNTGGMP